MEKIHKYKTLKGLLRNTQQFSLYIFLSCRYHHKKTGWGKLVLSPELKQEVYKLFADFLKVDFSFYVNTCGLFERLIINKNGNVSYIAGQYYPAEMRYLKRLLK